MLSSDTLDTIAAPAAPIVDCYRFKTFGFKRSSKDYQLFPLAIYPAVPSKVSKVSKVETTYSEVSKYIQNFKILCQLILTILTMLP
jgi:hypothetical protein